MTPYIFEHGDMTKEFASIADMREYVNGLDGDSGLPMYYYIQEHDDEGVLIKRPLNADELAELEAS